jgi:hypothetical protein
MLKTGLTLYLHAAEPFREADSISGFPDILRRFLFTTAYHSCPKPAESSPYSHKTTEHHFNAFLLFHLRLALPRGVFLSGFPINTSCAYLTSPMPLTSPPISWTFGEIYANNEKEVSCSDHFRRQRQKQKSTGKLHNLRELLTLYPTIFNHIIKHPPR